MFPDEASAVSFVEEQIWPDGPVCPSCGEIGNFTNRTLWTNDNFDVMRGMNGASVELIYLDPPFNSKRKTMDVLA